MISIIVAVAENNVIGKDNDLIWHLPNDMKFFRETTTGHAVIMGRKNWESIPERFRPLPNRDNYVITRNKAYKADGAIVCSSIDEAISNATSSGKDVYIIGGGQIYQQAIDKGFDEHLYITHVHAEFDGDTFFPEINLAAYQQNLLIEQNPDEKHQFGFQIVEYIKK